MVTGIPTANSLFQPLSKATRFGSATEAAAKPPALDTAVDPPVKPTRMFVLCSGMNDKDNEVSYRVQQTLLDKGVDPRAIIIVKTPYENFSIDKSLSSLRRLLKTPLSFRLRNTIKNLRTFLISSWPQSEPCQNAYREFRDQMDTRLRELGITDPKTIELVGVGYSAGGQMMGSLAHLASKDPERPMPFKTIITMGSPFLGNNAPADTRMIHYRSRSDAIAEQGSAMVNHMKALLHVLSRTVGGQGLSQRVPFLLNEMDDNDYLRRFVGVGHAAWSRDPKVLNQICQDVLSDAPDLTTAEQPQKRTYHPLNFFTAVSDTAADVLRETLTNPFSLTAIPSKLCNVNFSVLPGCMNLVRGQAAAQANS